MSFVTLNDRKQSSCPADEHVKKRVLNVLFKWIFYPFIAQEKKTISHTKSLIAFQTHLNAFGYSFLICSKTF